MTQGPPRLDMDSVRDHGRRRVQRLVAITLVIALSPWLGGVADQWETIERTDVATVHEPGGESLGTERGCSALFHLCSCHTSPSSTPTATGPRDIGRFVDSAGRFIVPDAKVAQTRNADPPRLPPPIG